MICLPELEPELKSTFLSMLSLKSKYKKTFVLMHKNIIFLRYSKVENKHYIHYHYFCKNITRVVFWITNFHISVYDTAGNPCVIIVISIINLHQYRLLGQRWQGKKWKFKRVGCPIIEIVEKHETDNWIKTSKDDIPFSHWFWPLIGGKFHKTYFSVICTANWGIDLVLDSGSPLGV